MPNDSRFSKGGYQGRSAKWCGDADLTALAAAYPVASPAMLQQRLAQAT
jgi:hypothetical protein